MQAPMNIIDGIAYADNQAEQLGVISVRLLANYKLWLRFSTGECRTFDCADLLKYPAYQRLKDKNVFHDVYIDHGAPTWCGGEIDIAPYVLYENSELLRS